MKHTTKWISRDGVVMLLCGVFAFLLGLLLLSVLLFGIGEPLRSRILVLGGLPFVFSATLFVMFVLDRYLWS